MHTAQHLLIQKYVLSTLFVFHCCGFCFLIRFGPKVFNGILYLVSDMIIFYFHDYVVDDFAMLAVSFFPLHFYASHGIYFYSYFRALTAEKESGITEVWRYDPDKVGLRDRNGPCTPSADVYISEDQEEPVCPKVTLL